MGRKVQWVFLSFAADVIIQGFLSYAPGWDCHGLPIEHNAMQQLGVGHFSTLEMCANVWFESDPHSLPRTVIRAKAMEFAKKEIQVQKEEFCELGIMADWDSQSATYRTLGEF